ncbi:arabinan endo-1,5-alpha-L-arabinosidase [Parvularcula maris]|uniref:arabinan endo-1,5-alpha-L-arabinosidase n=1 Tax=Parvularcula maris TaxID=2965077 RepID=UPI0021139DEA
MTGVPVNFVHDPTIVKIGDRYHLFHTSNDVDDAGYIYWRYSDDMINWRFAGAIFDEIPQYAVAEVTETDPNDPPEGVWAPHAMVVGDELWVYYSVFAYHESNGDRESLSGLVTIPIADIDVDDPMSGWTDQGLVINAEPEPTDRYSAIDVHVLEDPNDGKWWMTFGSYWSGIEIIELDPSTGKPFANTTPTNIGDTGTALNPIEAPVLVYRDGYYYLFVSKDACCQGYDSTYNVVVGRSPNPMGPYVDRDMVLMTDDGGYQVLDNDSDPTGRYRGPGHNDIYKEGDDWYIVYHAYRADGLPELRIHTLL